MMTENNFEFGAQQLYQTSRNLSKPEEIYFRPNLIGLNQNSLVIEYVAFSVRHHDTAVQQKVESFN